MSEEESGLTAKYENASAFESASPSHSLSLHLLQAAAYRHTFVKFELFEGSWELFFFFERADKVGCRRCR